MTRAKTATEFVDGRLMLKGHRITMSQLLRELLEMVPDKIKEVADDFSLDQQKLKLAYFECAERIAKLNE